MGVLFACVVHVWMWCGSVVLHVWCMRGYGVGVFACVVHAWVWCGVVWCGVGVYE